MTAFNTIVLFELYEIAKQGYLSGRTANVWIDVKSQSKGEKHNKQVLIQAYQDICSLYNDSRPMNYFQLFRILSAKIKKTITVIE